MNDKIKIAIIGTGSIGLMHLEAIEQSDDFELCAVCDVNEKAVKPIAEKYGVKYYTDYHEITSDSGIQAAILNLPHFLHCEASVWFLNNGIDVLVEKPMANTAAECDKMLEAEKKSGKKLAVGHVQRYFLANRAVKEYVESERLGKLVMYEERRTTDYFSDKRSRWFLDKKLAGGGIVMNYGAHALDKLFYITGMNEAEISSSFGNAKNEYNVEGHAQYFMKFKNGLSASVTFCGYAPCGYEVLYYFTNGTLKVSESDSLYEYSNSGWKPIEVKEDGGFLKRQLTEFAKYIRGENSEICSGEYGKKVIEAIEKIYLQ